MGYCPACGEQVTETDDFCNSCGSGLGRSEADTVTETTGEGPDAVAEGQGILQDRKKGYDFAAYYPKERGWKPVLISALLLLGSVLIIPAFILLGYSYRVGRAAATGQAEPPAYGDWGGLLFDGLRMMVVVFIPTILWAFVLGFVSALDPTLGLIAGVTTYWFVGAFLTSFMGNGSVRDTFTDGRVTSLLTSTFFLKAWLGFVLFIIGMWLIMAISIITIVGPLVLGAYIVVAIGAYWGHVHYHAVREGLVPEPVPFDDSEPVRTASVES